MKLVIISLDVSGYGELEYSPVMAPDDADLKALEKEYYQLPDERREVGTFVDGFVTWLINEKGFQKAQAEFFEMWKRKA